MTVRRMIRRCRSAWRVLTGKAQAVTVQAVLIHADGSREDLGHIGRSVSGALQGAGGDSQMEASSSG